ncbi:Malic enzyme [Mycena sanguinolenta]|uniref:Malic enzyme n=1 Tax=Mycena sanguinolenta TaxID=230812 RepID=A0A8H6XQ29_9AGAR|nr:Malic enzyme [Mycena sanguinolenta]
MTIVLTPYWSNGVQKLKMAPQPPPKPAHGLTPPMLDDEIHAQRCMAQLRSKDKDIEKYIYLSGLKEHDPHMFYRLCLAHMPEFTPIIYTPTVGQACQEYSKNYRRPEGLFVSIKDKGKIRSVLRAWPKLDDARISVVTDGSRILGLGDLGINGMPISIGKLSLYIAGAGIRPHSTIPICLDLGTNTQKYLDDPLYLGLRKKRVPTAEMTEFMDEFMYEMSQAFPKLLIQFEDFSTDHAFLYLERYRNQYPLFNDDIQGTGAVVLSGFINAARLSSAASGRPLSSHRILFFGAGSAGVGVAMQLMSFFTLNGMSEQEARERIWLVDSQGLVYAGRGELAEHKESNVSLVRRVVFVFPIYPLLARFFLSLTLAPHRLCPPGLRRPSDPGSARRARVRQTHRADGPVDVFRRVLARCNRGAQWPPSIPLPIIFPLSNPVKLSECTFEEAVKYTDGKVLFASGSPFHEMEWKGKMLYPGQGNNMYIFPGLGLGAILARCSSVTDSMVEASSLGLANSLTPQEEAMGLLYPAIDRIREISAGIAMQVIRSAQDAGVDRHPELRAMSDSELLAFVNSKMWNP